MDKLSVTLKLLAAVIFTTVHSSKIKEDPQKSIKTFCMEKCQQVAFHRLVSINQRGLRLVNFCAFWVLMIR